LRTARRCIGMTLADETNPIPPPAIAQVAPDVLSYETPQTSSLMGKLLSLRHRKAAWVLLDQGIVSLGNFLMLGVLQRTLVVKEMGAYQVLFETILYLNGIQNALVIYPLLVKGATGGRVNLGRLATASIILTLGLLPFLGGATVLSVGALQDWG